MLPIAYKNLRQFLTHNRIIFVLFALSFIISTVAITFLYSIFLFSERVNIDDGTRTYILTVKNNNTDLEISVEELYQERKDEIEKISFRLGEDRSVYAEYKYPDNPHVSYGSYFSREAFNSGDKQIILSAPLTDGSKEVGDTYFLDGAEYTIVGIQNRSYHEVPYKTVDIEEISEVTIVLSDIPNLNQVREWTMYLEGKFPDVGIIEPDIPELFDKIQAIYRAIMSIAVGFLAFFNFSYLYRYVLLKRRSQYACLRIAGCSRLQGISVYWAELSVLFVSLYTLSCLIFHTFVAPLVYRYTISPWFLEENVRHFYHLTIGDYTTLFIIVYSVLLLVFLPMIIRFSWQMPVTLWRKAAP